MLMCVCLSAGMYEDLKEYLNWYDTRRDTKFAADAPVIGLVLQRSHLVTGDEGHYSGVVSELEAQGAKVNHMSICYRAHHVGTHVFRLSTGNSQRSCCLTSFGASD